jgi:two-component system sensor histidine kinase KdpD
LNELVFTAIKDNNEEANNQQITFTPNENLPLFKLDSGIVEQIMYNLIHNVIQHTPENSIIEIKLNHNNTYCIICISDNGKGFPENEIDLVFDKFYRINNTSTGGTGLGLSIVKGFTEARNGTVHLKNLPHGGAKFTIEIPCEFSHNANL